MKDIDAKMKVSVHKINETFEQNDEVLIKRMNKFKKISKSVEELT